MPKLRAFSLVRQQPHYRHESFLAGLNAAGFEATSGHFNRPARPGEVLVVWNRGNDLDWIARKFESTGGIVIVAENGYIGRDENGLQHYALALHGHNGSGRWPVGDGSRWAKLGIPLKPWRAAGDFIYVRGQRGFGSPTMASPPLWHEDVARRLRLPTKRQVRIVTHPGKPACDEAQAIAIERDLAGAHACVVWSSAMGVRALVCGVPVFYEAPHWICAGAARHGITGIEQPLMDDVARLSALERMAWAQWSVAEIATGEPFRLLLECNKQQAAA